MGAIRSSALYGLCEVECAYVVKLGWGEVDCEGEKWCLRGNWRKLVETGEVRIWREGRGVVLGPDLCGMLGTKSRNG